MDVSNVTANIRVHTATQQGSVIDVIWLVNPEQDRSTSSKAIESLRSADEMLVNKLPQLKINGKGKLTPVADAATLVETRNPNRIPACKHPPQLPHITLHYVESWRPFMQQCVCLTIACTALWCDLTHIYLAQV